MNAAPQSRDVVAIGASAGDVEALTRLLRQLPGELRRRLIAADLPTRLYAATGWWRRR